MRYPYSQRYQPPAPDLDAAATNRSTAESVPVTLLVDTGADRTCIPSHPKLRRKAKMSRRPVVLADGTETNVDLVNVHLKLGGREIKNVEVFLIDPACCGLLGRDILNRYKIVLDGPAQEWSVYRRTDWGEAEGW